MGKQIFISYSADDKKMAFKICAFLEKKNFGCWIAPRDVIPGAVYSEEIVDAIEHSEVMILVLSSKANLSNHVRNEVERAVSKGKTILPVRVEDVKPSRALELFISSHHWIDAHIPPLEERLEKLEIAIKGILGRPSAAPEEAIAFGEQRRIQDLKTYPRNGIITGNQVSVRGAPTVVAKIIKTLDQGDEIEIISETAIAGSRECQLKDDFVFEPQEKESFRLQAGKGLVISGETGTHYRIEIKRKGCINICYVPKEAVVLLEPAIWYKIKMDPSGGWVFSRYVRVF